MSLKQNKIYSEIFNSLLNFFKSGFDIFQQTIVCVELFKQCFRRLKSTKLIVHFVNPDFTSFKLWIENANWIKGGVTKKGNFWKNIKACTDSVQMLVQKLTK